MRLTAADFRQSGENRLLAALPHDDYQRLLPSLELVHIELRQVLHRSREPIAHAYFPRSGMVSLVTIMDDGAAVEVASIGREGLVGLPIHLGAAVMSVQALCLIPGEAVRVRADVVREEVQRRGALHELLQRYALAVFNDIVQTAACNLLHRMDGRCARWLLMTQDRLGADEFPLTQEFLAQMLGARRASVSEVASRLQSAGVIRYRRGRLTIADRHRLEAEACECYRKVATEYPAVFAE
jgi:CRP-like cAMP-binding protein